MGRSLIFALDQERPEAEVSELWLLLVDARLRWRVGRAYRGRVERPAHRRVPREGDRRHDHGRRRRRRSEGLRRDHRRLRDSIGRREGRRPRAPRPVAERRARARARRRRYGASSRETRRRSAHDPVGRAQGTPPPPRRTDRTVSAKGRARLWFVLALVASIAGFLFAALKSFSFLG